jgi:hypothetical protein
MSFVSAETPVRGTQLPRIATYPRAPVETGDDAIELARAAGLRLDEWQELVLRVALGERPDGRWAAFEVGLCVSRQNGKGALLEARELAGAFLLGERLITHSAHQYDTSMEAFRRLEGLIEEADFQREVKRIIRSHGEEGIELKSGQRIRFRTRTKSGGRGFTGDLLILDEAMDLPESKLGALMPTLSARPNPQIWYTGSAVDQEVHDNGLVFSRVRERGIRGGDPALAYFEWSLPYDLPDEVPDDVACDPAAWADANPALGIRITAEYVAKEQRSLAARTFAVERLGVGDWPQPDVVEGQVIDPAVWAALTDLGSKAEDPVVFAFDVRPDRSAAAIGVAGRRDDGQTHVEIVEHREGAGWLPKRLAELVAKHQPAGVLCQQASAAAALLVPLANLGVNVTAVSTGEYAEACGALFDAVDDETVRHLGSRELASAVKGAVKRQVGDTWVWSRKSSQVDISPLVAVTLALWKSTHQHVEPFVVWAAR